MRQRRFAKTSSAEDDGLPQVTSPGCQLSSDSVIVAKSHSDNNRSFGNRISIHTMRDAYSGMTIGIPQKSKTKDAMYDNFKWYAGPIRHRPHVVVKSDNAGEITESVRALGWHPETSLADRWPHNASHERWHGSYKSCIRAAMLQSGFPERAWDLCVLYCSIVLSVLKMAPILLSERDSTGQVLESAKPKLSMTCWEAHHKGDAFTGPIQPFGRLVYYYNRHNHPMMPTTSPGFFMGWRLESVL